MNQNTRSNPHLTVGMDLSDRTTRICILDAGGEILEETRLSLMEPVVRRRFCQLPSSRVALEVGTHSPWVSRLLAQCGHEVLVANPRQVALIARSDRRSDRTDAESLARIARVDPRLLSRLQAAVSGPRCGNVGSQNPRAFARTERRADRPTAEPPRRQGLGTGSNPPPVREDRLLQGCMCGRQWKSGAVVRSGKKLAAPEHSGNSHLPACFSTPCQAPIEQRCQTRGGLGLGLQDQVRSADSGEVQRACDVPPFFGPVEMRVGRVGGGSGSVPGDGAGDGDD